MSLVLTGREVLQVLTLDLALEAVRQAFLAHGEGRVNQPPKAELPVGTGSMKAMYGEIRLPQGRVCGIKWNANFPGNPKLGLPTIMGKLLLNDPDTGLELADMDATHLTRYRTGAAGAVAASVLARPEASRLGVVGAGVQARTQIAALLEVRPIRRITVASRTREHAQALCREVTDTWGVTARVADSPAEAVRDQDIVVTVTPSLVPLVQRPWVEPGTHINAFGADGPGKQELDPAILRDATVVVDDLAQAAAIGEINVPLARGELSLDRVHGTLGEILAGRKPGRRAPGEITVFDATGLAIQDLALGLMILHLARAQGLGQEKVFWQ